MYFDWDCDHVLHHANNYHKHICAESLYINLKANNINDESANFHAIYRNVLKHEWNLNPLLDFLEFVFLLPALVPVQLLAHHSVYPIINRYLRHNIHII